MNFDYLKKLDVLSKTYYSCNNAEELALTKPDLSMVAARKSAEAVAKFVYRVAHSEEADYITFVDILRDPVVRDYLRKRSVLDAFHYVRKSGNEAVHTLEEESPENAIAVLEKLYYAVGETAKSMRLVKDYPPFDSNLEEHPEAELLSDEFYGKLDKEMYDEYVIHQQKINVLKVQLSELNGSYVRLHGDVTINEVVEFKKQPELYGTLYKIQEYFATLGNHALEPKDSESDDCLEESYKLELTISGENGYTTNNLYDAIYGILYDLPQAEGFRITSYYSGDYITTLFKDYHVGGFGFFEDELPVFRDLARFADIQDASFYKKFEFQYKAAGGGCEKLENGNQIDLEASYSADIIDRNFGQDWWCWSVDLGVWFDFEKHSDILRSLYETVRKYVPEDQLKHCEWEWTHENGDAGLLLSGIQWFPRTLRVVQTFLDEVNTIILPIKDECECVFDGRWFITEDPFAVAKGICCDEGFKVVGTEL